MFGKNIARKLEHGSGMSLKVQSLFYTIQGEGLFVGHPAVFVRLWGCHLRCTFCDTDFESNEEELAVEQIVERVEREAQKRTSLVVLTGGEPLRQNVCPLMQQLNTRSYNVQIETAGNVWLDGLQELVPINRAVGVYNTIICSPKTPQVHQYLEPLVTAWKYIVSADDPDFYHDGLPSHSTQTPRLIQVIRRPSVNVQKSLIFLQPMDEQDEQRNRANVEHARDLCLKYGYRLSLQTHKLIGVP